MNEDANGKIVNVDGQKVSIATARVIDRDNNDAVVDYKTYRKKMHETHREKGTQPIEERKGMVHIVEEADDGGKSKELGCIEVEGDATLEDVRHQISEEKMLDVDFVFLVESLPLDKH